MSTIKPRRMQWEEIREKAEEFRKKIVHPGDKTPIPIEEILEFDLNITPWPVDGLLEKIDIDGFLSNDLKTLFVDKRIYMDFPILSKIAFHLCPRNRPSGNS